MKGDGANQAYGLDASFSFHDNVNLYGYYARTNTRGLREDNESYQTAFSYEGDLYACWSITCSSAGTSTPRWGFLRREDFRRTYVYGQFSPGRAASPRCASSPGAGASTTS